jgi:hypothetical protein
VQSSTEASVIGAAGQILGDLRLRAAASIMMLSCWRSMVMERICGSEALGVFDILQQAAGGAQAAGAFSTPKPTRSRVPNCRLLARGVDFKFPAGDGADRGGLQSATIRQNLPHTAAAGLVRCSSAAMVSRSAGSLRRNVRS